MASKPGFDVRDGYCRGESRQRPAKRARRVALDDEQVGGLAQLRQDRRGHGLDVRMRVLRPRAIQSRRRISAEAMVGGVEVGVLAGQDQSRLHIASRERSGDGGKLDRFGPGADDEPDIRRKQTSPLLGRGSLHPQWTECKLC